MKRMAIAAAALTLLIGAGAAQAQVTTKKTLTLDGARRVVAAAAAEAGGLGAPGGAIAVVDDGGHAVALERLDGTPAAAAAISAGKARTAALFKRPTRVFEDIINKGRTTMVTLPDFTPLQGGVPITVDGQVVGAVGVSGAATAPQDEEIAMAGARALEGLASAAPGSPEVSYLGADRVAAAFARGMPLLEVEGYKVHASRREAPGMAEVHDWETDVVYVLEGTATVVTGGAVVDPRVTEPGQVRGARIQGGESRELARGDVMVIPAGVPHWFKEVKAPFLYFVVKPIAMNGSAK